MSDPTGLFRTGKCASCGAPIQWARTPSGKTIPLDPLPCGDGNLLVQDGLIVVVAPGECPGAARFKTHFATCPSADEHRKPPAPEDPMNGNGQHPSDHSDLDRFGDSAAPQHQFAPNLETVPDGDYDCEVTGAELGLANGDKVLRVGLKLLNAGGRQVEHTYWLNKPEVVNDFLAEMMALGFPARDWGNGPGKVKLSVAVPGCAAEMRGLRFRARKASRVAPAQPAKHGQPARPERTFHNLYIAGRITGAPMPSLGQAPRQPQQAPAFAGAPPQGEEEDIPFGPSVF